MDADSTALGRYAVRVDHVAIAIRNLEAAIAFYPGDLEAAAARSRRDDGIPVSADDVMQFRKAGIIL